MAASHPVLFSLVSTVAAAAHGSPGGRDPDSAGHTNGSAKPDAGPFIRGDRAARDGQRAGRHKIIG